MSLSGGNFDYIIIGGGSAGCALANRLSANENNKVLLIEAGGKNDDLLVKMPAGVGKILPSANKYNWAFETEPEIELNNRKLYWPRGRGLGGSSSINAMIYTRGHPYDYDDWAKLGLVNWNYQNLLKYFKRAENFLAGENQYHGINGPLNVSIPNSSHAGNRAFLSAAKEAGFKINDDFNGINNEGFGKYHLTIKDGQRCSTYAAYIKPIENRKNLKIICNKIVSRIIFDGKIAKAIEYFDDIGANPKIIYAKREIIISAGAIGSPKILLLSGIGPIDELKEIGINPIASSLCVGKNLQDHLDIIISQETDAKNTYYSLTKGLKEMKIGLEYIFRGTGLGRENFLEFGGFAKSNENLFRPNLQFHFMNGIFKNHNRTKVKKDGFGLHVCNLYPESRGEIILKAQNPFIASKIKPNYLATEKDKEVMRAGFKMARKIFNQPAFLGTREFEPGAFIQTDDQIDAWIKENAETIYHPIGTCRMGIDEESVVDENLKVRGVENLRVIDASIMPRLIGGNTNAPTIAIAEFGADIILQPHHFS